MDHALLDAIGDLSVVVFGDFAVDRYLHLDPSIRDRSKETRLPIRQVCASRSTPGAAGTVANNLAALGAGRVIAVGVVGDDGEGFELRRGLQERGVDCSRLLTVPERPTPVYMKILEPDGEGWREHDRLDVFPRKPLQRDHEERLLDELEGACEGAGALVIADYGETGKAGVVGGAARERASRLARQRPGLTVVADSRLRLDLFEGVAIKPNELELRRLLELPEEGNLPVGRLLEGGRRLAAQRGAPIYATLGERGALACDAEKAHQLPAWPASGRIDVCGAGDAFTAGLVCALAAGRGSLEATRLGLVCASLCVEQIDTTGVASRDSVGKRLRDYARRFPDACDP